MFNQIHDFSGLWKKSEIDRSRFRSNMAMILLCIVIATRFYYQWRSAIFIARVTWLVRFGEGSSTEKAEIEEHHFESPKML